MQIVSLALEKRMLFDMQHDIQIARRAAVSPSFAKPRKADTGAVFNACGHLCVHCPLTQHAAFAFALWTGIGNHAARTLTGRTSTRHAEKPLLVADLPATSAGSAWDGCFAGRRPVA